MATEAGEAGEARSLEYTPTWALATVSTIFIVISFLVERSLHWLGDYLHRRKRKSMHHALQKVKDELMLVGFISLTLALLQDPISKICIRSSLYTRWAPCKLPVTNETEAVVHAQVNSQWPSPSDVAWLVQEQHGRRLLASESAASSFACPAEHEPFLSSDGFHQLHIFIFVLAANHVLFTFITMALALLKVHTWKKWEVEAQKSTSPDGMAELIINNISYTRQSTFMRYHTSKPWSRSRFIVWVVCFFQQFHIPRADYLTLRFSFITVHNFPYQYNFHDYMVRSMEDEFETIVGISSWLWAFVIVFLLFNVQGTHLYFWTSFIPVVVIIAIGTKLQHVVATLAMESSGALPFPGPFMGALLKPRDQLFWFNRPKLLLLVIHVVLFQSAFEMSTFIWQVWQFGWHSCLLDDNKAYVYARLTTGFVVQIFCSFSTLPLYALVSQMGSSYKKAVVPPRVNRVLQKWHKDAKKRLKNGTDRGDPDSVSRHSPLTATGGQGSSNNFHSINLTSPMTLAMEEGSDGNRKTNEWPVPLSPDSSVRAGSAAPSSAAGAVQNVWERRLRQTKSGRLSKKALAPISQEMQVMAGSAAALQSVQRASQGGVTVSISSTPGSDLRRRASPNIDDAATSDHLLAHQFHHPLQSSSSIT